MRGRAEITKANRRRSNPATTRCYLCTEPILHSRKEFEGRFTFRGVAHVICERCRGKYWRPVEQASQFGKRFRFVERHEVKPRFDRGAAFTKVFHVLTLAIERQKIRQKEVNWMADDMTKKILGLPGKVAAIVRQTYAVMGDDFKLSDNIALQQIRDLLEEIDPNIMSIKKKKKLS